MSSRLLVARRKHAAISINVSDRVFAMVIGLSLSVVAAFYAVTGLAAIFAGAFIPVIIMGSVLEVGKIITASYLYRNWNIMPRPMRVYFTGAVSVLMMITSIGVFGYLSKAHIDQNAPSGDISAAIERLDQRVARERSRIANAEKITAQLDAAIDKYILVEQVTRGLEARKVQAKEREAIRLEIRDAQANVDSLLDERSPLTQKIRDTQIEVGPIRYVAELIYGENTPEVLDKAVRAIIIALVLVLDPLAILLIISANSKPISFLPKSPIRLDSSDGTAVDARGWKTMEDVIITKKKSNFP